jgi:pimeloyl-ACP methyl ester carboxylesterase
MEGRKPIRIISVVALVAGWLLAGCSMVGVKHVSPKEYAAQRRSDVLSTRKLSDSTVQALNVVALSRDDCAANFPRCTNTLLYTDGLDDERRLSALSELWLAYGLQQTGQEKTINDAALNDYLQSARYAYAYLFYTARNPGERAFETRQSQVLDFYNYSVQQAVGSFFQRLPQLGTDWSSAPLGGWRLLRPSTDVYLGSGDYIPKELIPAEGLRFSGLRNIYRRDGFGSEFVAVGATPPDTGQPWREPNHVPLTAVLQFPGKDLASVLNTSDVRLYAKNPYLDNSIRLDDQTIPLAANFTAPYGVWLARSGFAQQSIRSLLGRGGGLTKPEVLLMQPYDPDRLTVIMLHGLASSPEAWINVVNEVMGDESLRRTYQVWEVYYPTNVPVAVNLAQIRRALDDTLHHFDPTGKAVASNNIVLIGHSMGGVLARLLVSSSDDKLWSVVPERPGMSDADRQKLRQRLAPYLQFSPMPQVTRAVFLAAPHRGTPVARWRLARWIGSLIRLPLTLLEEGKNITDSMQGKNAVPGTPARLPNSIDNLSDADPFIKASSTLPISPKVHYHTIVGTYKSTGPLADSDDGVVPYASSHLDGADSELAVPSWHDVQEMPQAIIELRRILRVHAANLHCLQAESGEQHPCPAAVVP